MLTLKQWTYLIMVGSFNYPRGKNIIDYHCNNIMAKNKQTHTNEKKDQRKNTMTCVLIRYNIILFEDLTTIGLTVANLQFPGESCNT